VSVVGNQAQTFLRLAAALRPRWRSDPALPRQLQARFAQERGFGSRDRRLYRELVYTTLRYLPWIEPWLDREPERAVKLVAWLAADTRDTRAFRAELAGDWPAATSLAERAAFLAAEPRDLLPAWFRGHCAAVFAPAELETLLMRAPLWLRLQTDEPAAVADEFALHGWHPRTFAELPSAWRRLDEVDVTKSKAFQHGRIEVQDLGSQLLLESVGIERGTRWLDACAGAGGKTLQLARLVGEEGTVTAHDIRVAALAELGVRAARAGLRNITVAEKPRGEFDGVLVDAPCSGSGTWRRAPHLKWCTSEATVARAAAMQRTLLDRFSAHVKPRGRLVYATCSLSSRENEDIVAGFLAAHPEFCAEPFGRTFGAEARGAGLLLLPSLHDTDGFFVASLRRR